MGTNAVQGKKTLLQLATMCKFEIINLVITKRETSFRNFKWVSVAFPILNNLAPRSVILPYRNHIAIEI